VGIVDVPSNHTLVVFDGVLVDQRRLNGRVTQPVHQRLQRDPARRCRSPCDVAEIMETQTGHAGL
jgi:hypothetical protein